MPKGTRKKEVLGKILKLINQIINDEEKGGGNKPKGEPQMQKGFFSYDTTVFV